MGAPRFGWEEIPLAYALDTTALPVGWEMLEGAAAINVGNPHLVFFVPDLDDVPLERLGPQIETDPLFPNRINVNVAQIIDKGRVRARTWERGAGLTQAGGHGDRRSVGEGKRVQVRVDPGGGRNIKKKK